MRRRIIGLAFCGLIVFGIGLIGASAALAIGGPKAVGGTPPSPIREEEDLDASQSALTNHQLDSSSDDEEEKVALNINEEVKPPADSAVIPQEIDEVDEDWSSARRRTQEPTEDQPQVEESSTSPLTPSSPPAPEYEESQEVVVPETFRRKVLRETLKKTERGPRSLGAAVPRTGDYQIEGGRIVWHEEDGVSAPVAGRDHVMPPGIVMALDGSSYISGVGSQCVIRINSDGSRQTISGASVESGRDPVPATVIEIVPESVVLDETDSTIVFNDGNRRLCRLVGENLETISENCWGQAEYEADLLNSVLKAAVGTPEERAIILGELQKRAITLVDGNHSNGGKELDPVQSYRVRLARQVLKAIDRNIREELCSGAFTSVTGVLNIDEGEGLTGAFSIRDRQIFWEHDQYGAKPLALAGLSKFQRELVARGLPGILSVGLRPPLFAFDSEHGQSQFTDATLKRLAESEAVDIDPRSMIFDGNSGSLVFNDGNRRICRLSSVGLVEVVAACEGQAEFERDLFEQLMVAINGTTEVRVRVLRELRGRATELIDANGRGLVRMLNRAGRNSTVLCSEDGLLASKDVVVLIARAMNSDPVHCYRAALIRQCLRYLSENDPAATWIQPRDGHRFF